jgi:hypothetical protein
VLRERSHEPFRTGDSFKLQGGKTSSRRIIFLYAPLPRDSRN